MLLFKSVGSKDGLEALSWRKSTLVRSEFVLNIKLDLRFCY